MSQQIINLQTELDIFIEENQRMKRQIDFMRRTREEQNNFELEENRKVMRDT